MMQPGVMVGLVKSVADPAGQGRLQLTFPTMGGVASAWAPVASELAGKDRGAWFMPELQDEVLVAFDQGNFDHPYVVGFLWNGIDKPPETDVKNRIIKTPGGHQLRFEDKDGAKKVILKTDGGLAITMDDANKTIEIKCGGQTFTMDDNQQKIAITGGGRAVTMQAGQLKIT
jgi:phage baseplate assembly protein V